MQVDMPEAKNRLSKLLEAALASEDVIIANHGEPTVRLLELADRPLPEHAAPYLGNMLAPA